MKSRDNIINAVICGSEDKNDELSEQFKDIGINAIFLKTIDIVPLTIEDLSIFDKTFDYTILTSKNSVTCLFDILEHNNLKLNSKKLVCIGKKTKETCEKYGNFVIDIPTQNSSAGIFNYFLNKNLNETEILIPGSKISNLWYVERLKANGANVYFIPVYDNRATKREDIEKVIEAIKNKIIKLYIFTSPSAFNNLIEIESISNLHEYFKHKKIAAIGKVTKEAIEQQGIRVDIVPENFNFNELIKSINNYYCSMEKN
jgi:uroporphyrinogen-III synthase